MGVVFQARLTGEGGFSRLVAIKCIHAALARDPGIRDAFVAEALTAQRLLHGGIVQLIDVGLDADVPYLVLEHVDGASLAELLHGPGAARPLPIADALHIVESVAAALAYAHGLADAAGRPEGVVHRDVTPRNILISRDGVVKLADFGIAKALSAPSYTLPGTFKGSLGYLAPEQARGEPVDARADQFSLGIVLHELVSGQNPIAARDVESYHRALTAGVPPLAAAPPADTELAAIVARATALDPAARHGSMDELRSELEAWRVARGIRTSGESLRAVMRERLDEQHTAPGTSAAPQPKARPQPRPLGDALGDALGEQLPPSATQRVDPAARAPARRGPGRRALIAGAGLAGLGAIALAVALLGGRAPASTRPPAEARPEPREAAPAPAAVPASAAPTPAPTSTAATPAPAAAAAAAPAAAAAAPAAAPAAPALAPRPAARKPGRLKIMVVPWATVLLDDRPLGGVPIDREVASGRHRLTLHNPDTGDRVERAIDVPPGGLTEVTSW